MHGHAAALLEFPKVLERLSRFAVSESGQRACLELPLLPDAAAVLQASRLHEETAAFAAANALRPAEFPPLDGLFHFLDSGRAGAAAPLDLDALASLRDVLSLARRFVDALEPRSPRISWPLLAEEAQTLRWPAQTQAALVRCISPDGLLKDESSPELYSVRMELRELHRQCTAKAKEFIQAQKLSPWLMDDYITIASDRYVLPLKTSFKNRLPGIIHDYSQTGETCYFEPLFLVERNNAAQELKREEREAERQVLGFLTGLVLDELEACKAATAFLVAMDVRFAVLSLGQALRATPLEMAPGLPLSLKNVRHPLLVLAPHPGGKTVPLDIALTGEQRVLVISGGNAGGKTVCLKTLGLAALMARAGLPVPADHGATLPWFENFVVFLGDEQSLEDHVSTFTAQITRLRDAWHGIDPDTLVLLDEFGAGTDPAQGSALAQAVLDELLEKGAWAAAATHFPALKAYALADPGVRAASVLFDPVHRKPLYKLGLDQVGASQALDVAREHGLPETILRRAEQHLLLDGEDAQALIDRLNHLAVDREREVAALERERKDLREKEKVQREKLAREQAALFAELKAQSQKILRAWQSGKTAHKQAMKELAQVRADLKAAAAPAAPGSSSASGAPAKPLALEDLRKGDRVRYLPWNKIGQVEDLDAKRGAVKLDLAGVSLWVAPAELREVEEGAPAAPRAASAAAKAPKAPDASGPGGAMRLDLRGRRADEALRELAEGLDKALLRNFSQLEVVHGRGTGALRKEIHAWCKGNPAIASFVLANEDVGGDGVTVVTLR